jgi:thymidylate synthase (FAD)
MNVKLLSITPNADELIEHAGRVCHQSNELDGTDTETFIRYLVKVGHESVIEHATATFEISGISRACSHQLVRHRIASYSQESQRYVDMSDPEYVMPPTIEDDAEALETFTELCYHVTRLYRELRELGIPKEDARFVLPNATATRIVVTMNFRELLHFFRLRTTPHAQWEIRWVALWMLDLLGTQSVIFYDFLARFIDYHPDLYQQYLGRRTHYEAQ